MEVDGEDPPGPSGRATTKAPPRRWNQRGAPDEFEGPPPSGGHETFWLSCGSDEDDGSDEDYDDDELDRGARGAGTSGERAAADNDDAFYASSMDDEDERWVEKQRGGRVSDAILSCPCCLEIVTIDCQRHHRREGQYRAMFVRNVRVDASVALRPMDRDAKTDATDATSANANARAFAANEDADAEGPFHEVFCDACGTSVGVRDADEVYHFFHVFPSNA